MRRNRTRGNAGTEEPKKGRDPFNGWPSVLCFPLVISLCIIATIGMVIL